VSVRAADAIRALEGGVRLIESSSDALPECAWKIRAITSWRSFMYIDRVSDREGSQRIDTVFLS
jgi:hypothetical protein